MEGASSVVDVGVKKGDMGEVRVLSTVDMMIAFQRAKVVLCGFQGSSRSVSYYLGQIVEMELWKEERMRLKVFGFLRTEDSAKSCTSGS